MQPHIAEAQRRQARGQPRWCLGNGPNPVARQIQRGEARQVAEGVEHDLVDLQAHVAKFQMSQLRQASQGRCQRRRGIHVRVNGQAGDVGEALKQLAELCGGAADAAQRQRIHAFEEERR